VYVVCVFKTALHVFVPAFKKVTFSDKVKVGDTGMCAVYPCMLSVSMFLPFETLAVCTLLQVLWFDDEAVESHAWIIIVL